MCERNLKDPLIGILLGFAIASLIYLLAPPSTNAAPALAPTQEQPQVNPPSRDDSDDLLWMILWMNLANSYK